MSLKLNTNYLKDFISDADYKAIDSEIRASHKTLTEKTGAGNDFLGWVDLPENYDKEEFARIKLAAKKIRSDSEVLVVIGIGGSYLGARAAIEFCKSQNYNLVCKDAPQIFFIQKANEYKSSIWVEKDERRVNAKSLLGVLSLGIVGGTTIRIIADGADEEQAVNGLVKLVESGFAE